MQLLGIHYLTAVSASIRENLRFYTGTMGMRLVKRKMRRLLAARAPALQVGAAGVDKPRFAP